ncbi:UNVERIFIED_CONTAM: hypothetical protein Scaly_2010600 [Sesamum calycinum]|uniref:SWIM-type domain-containing protein n=1 Tax=Sesamum calycinum TaxID=2727403 RepID=A0AAW2N1N7_9LAMI
MTGYVSIDIFVQAEKIREMVVPDDPAVSEWGTYMSMLTQELSSVPVVTQSMGPSDYAGPSSFAGPSDYAEPDEVEVEGLTTNNPENNDEDFSVRFARREYRVVESKPKLWKVACKYDQQTGCSWMLRGIFQPNMGLFKITKYAGPHTCLMNEISVEHGNLGKSMIATHLLGMVRQDPAYDIKFVQQNVKDRFVLKYLIIRWQSLKAAREQVYDANQQVLPLAFALVDEESLASWRWFLQMLAKHLLPNDDDRVCLISDRHSGLISAINYVPAFKFPRGVHRFCLRHVCSNFNKKFNNIRLKDLCWRAGAEVNARKFERIMTEIRELNEEAYNWLGMIDKTQWTLSHDSGWRTGILTTNMSECVNGVLKGARRLPIVAIVQITFHRSVRYFLERTTRCHRMLNANQEWADFAFRIFEARQAEAVHHIVQKFDYNQQSASVLTLSLTGQGSHTYVVKLKHKTCSCGKWGTHGIPCSHAIQVSRHFGVNASNFIPQYYSIRAYRKTYQGRFEPLYGEEYWDPVDIELVHNPAVEFAEDQADMFRRGYQMKWIDHKHVLANNINLVKFRINVITL